MKNENVKRFWDTMYAALAKADNLKLSYAQILMHFFVRAYHNEKAPDAIALALRYEFLGSLPTITAFPICWKLTMSFLGSAQFSDAAFDDLRFFCDCVHNGDMSHVTSKFQTLLEISPR